MTVLATLPSRDGKLIDALAQIVGAANLLTGDPRECRLSIPTG